MALRWAALPVGFWPLALGLFGSACLFTDPINRAPQARIDEESVGPYFIDTEIRLSARKSSDPDGDPISLWWLVHQRDEAEPTGWRELRDERGRLTEVYSIPAGSTDKGRIRVTLTARDRHGAVGGAEQFFPVINRQPQVELQDHATRLADGTYLVGREIVAVAEASDPDEDDVDLSFSVFPPAESRPDDLVSEAIDDTQWRLVPDVPGIWEIEVKADDGDGLVATDSETFQVSPDSPPCIAATEPPAPGGGLYVLGADEAPRRFSVLAVDDELDAHPARAGDPDAGEASFTWSAATPATGGTFDPVSGRDAPDFVIDPAEHAPGDILALRVDVADRIERDIACGDDRLTCSIGDNDCIQRTTWEVEIR